MTAARLATAALLVASATTMGAQTPPPPQAGAERPAPQVPAADATTPLAHRVVLTAGRDREAIAVSIVDNGKGIPEKDLRRIFEPFFTTKPVGQGSGMGLDIVQAILVRNNGSIEVSSTPGRTEFRVRLPIAEAPQQVKA